MKTLSNTNEFPAGYLPYFGNTTIGLLLPNALRTNLLAEQAAQLDAQRAEYAQDKDGALQNAETMTAAKAAADIAYASNLSKCVATFDLDHVNNVLYDLQHEDEAKSRRAIPTLQAALVDHGMRELIKQPLSSVMSDLKRLGADMPNFRAVADLLCAELALAMASRPSNFRVTCLCLNGPPGIGKTRFAKELARILNVGFEEISLGAMQGSFELSGVAAGWSNTRPGRLVKLLAEGKSACPVVLLDEIDKTGADERYSPVPVLLDLLEKETAACFRDDSLELRMDASKIIFIATSNTSAAIPDVLKSRMRMVDVPAPTEEQRRQIIDNITVDFVCLGVKFPAEVIDALCAIDMDLRGIAQLVREMAGKTLVSGKNEATLDDLPTHEKKQQMGFV